MEAPSGGEELLDRLQELAPKDEKQRLLQAQATSVVLSLGETHWLQYAQGAISVSMPLLIALIFGLTTVFVSFALFAPGNATVLTSLLVSALSVAAAILLILELYSPYSGLIQVSSAPLRGALTQLGNYYRAAHKHCSVLNIVERNRIGCRLAVLLLEIPRLYCLLSSRSQIKQNEVP